MRHLLKRIEAQRVKMTAGVFVAFAIFVLCTILFVQVADEVREEDTLALDAAVLNAIHSYSNLFLDVVMPVATDVGGVIGVVAITTVSCALLMYRNQRRRALVLGVCVAGAAILNLLLKAIFERARPELWERLIYETGFSFPSGHAMASAALGIGLVLVLWGSRWRWRVAIAAAAYVLFVGFSRMYLGVHYPSDIVAGWLVSGAWVMVVGLMFRSRLGNQVLSHLRR